MASELDAFAAAVAAQKAGGTRAGGGAASAIPLGNKKKIGKAQRFLAARGIDPKQLSTSFGTALPATGGQPVMSMDELKTHIGNLVASMPKDKPKNDSGWAKGLGLVGKALNIIDIPGSYLRSGVSSVATGIEEGDLSKVLGGLPVVNTIANTVDNFGGDPNAPKGLLNKVLFADKQQSKDFYNHTGTGEYLQRGIDKHGWQDTALNNDWLKRGIGLAGDIGLDPLTYATLGTGAVVESSAKGAATVGAKAAVDVAGEQAVKELAKVGAEQGAKAVGEATGKSVLADVAGTVGKTASKDAAESAAKSGVAEIGEIAADIGKRKSRVLRGWKEISDHIFEQARALDPASEARAQLEQMGARIRKARSTWVASNAELQQAGVKRGVWLVGSRSPLGANSKVLEGALRAQEAVGGMARKAISDPAAKLLEGTFGQEGQNVLRKLARSGVGDMAQLGVTALAMNKDARHAANGLMLDLASGFGKAMDVAEKNGLDASTVTRAVQDDQVLAELAQRAPKAAEAITGIRDEFRRARNMYENVTGVQLPDNNTYMPRRMTSDAWDLINKSPDFKSEFAGPATFTQARTIRSGQDNALREADKQSTTFLGAEVPRNMSDAQVTDWAEGRYKQIFGPDAPDLFKTDARELISTYLSEFKKQTEKDMFTGRMLEAGIGSQDAQKAWSLVSGTADMRKAKVAAVADQFMGKVADVGNQMDAGLADLNKTLEDIRFAKGFKGGKAEFDKAVGDLRYMKEELAQGNFEWVKVRSEGAARDAYVKARKAEGKLAELWKQFGDRMTALRDAAEVKLRDAGTARNAFQQMTVDTGSAAQARLSDQLVRGVTEAQARFNKLPQSQQEEWVKFLGGNKQAAGLYKTMQDQYMIGNLLSKEASSGAAIAGHIDDLKRQLVDLTNSLTDRSGTLVGSTSKELQTAANDTIVQLDKIASSAKNTLADELYAQAAVIEAESKFLLSYAFNKTETKALPADARVPRSGVLKSNVSRDARKEVAKSQAGVRKLLAMDAEDQIRPLLQNAIARSALSEGFASLPAEARNLYKQAEENLLKQGNLKNALHLYDKLNNVLKGWLIAKPGFVFRNQIGGLFMNMVAGVSVSSHLKMLKCFEADILRQQGKPGAWEKLNKYDRKIYEMVRSFQSQGDTLTASMTHGTPNPTLASRFNPFSANFFWLAGNRNFNQFAEDVVLRGSMAFDTLSRDPALIAAFKVGDPTQVDRAFQVARSRAIGRVDMFHFSYDKADKSAFENEVMGRLVPFYTYTRNVIPLITSMMIERPKYFAWMNSVARNLQLGVPVDSVVPEYIKESGAIRTPFSAGGSRVYWMQDLPFNQLIDINNDPVNFAASAFTPLVKTPVELAQGQQFYKKIPLTSDMKPSQYQNVPGLSQALSALGAQQTGNDGKTQFMQDRLQYALGQLAPPLYTVGNYSGATDQQKLKLPTRALSDLTGLRVRVNTPEDQANELSRRNIKQRDKKSQQTRNANRGFGKYPAGYKPKNKKK